MPHHLRVILPCFFPNHEVFQLRDFFSQDFFGLQVFLEIPSARYFWVGDILTEATIEQRSTWSSPNLIYFSGVFFAQLCQHLRREPTQIVIGGFCLSATTLAPDLSFQPLCICTAAYGHLLIRISSSGSVHCNFSRLYCGLQIFLFLAQIYRWIYS